MTELLGDQCGIGRGRMNHTLEHVTELADKRGDARGQGAGRGGTGEQSPTYTRQTPTAFVKRSACTSRIDFDLDGLPVLVGQISLFAARSRSELEARVEKQVVAELGVAQNRLEIELLECLACDEGSQTGHVSNAAGVCGA